MYRILGQHGEVRERREQLRHPACEFRSIVITGSV
jgi:hypothetical protein